MLRWIATTAALATLLVGTALMANAAEWTVIGDGYVPVETVRGAEESARAATPAATPWAAVEDGYVFRHDEARVASDDESAAPPACCAEKCPGADCEHMADSRWQVIGDGYVPGSRMPESGLMSCC